MCYQWYLSVMGLIFLTNSILINIEQVREVQSAHLFDFIQIQSTRSFMGEAPEPWGYGGNTPGSGV